MCGRYTLDISTSEIRQKFGVALEAAASFDPSYNIAPSNLVPIVGANNLGLAFWGWSVRDSYQINARAETITQKPAFRESFIARRCLIPATAFYEWQHNGQRKGQPFAVRPKVKGGLFAFAGLHRHFGSQIQCVIVTIAANAKLEAIHPREPVMLPKTAWKDWLSAKPNKALDLLKTSEVDSIKAYPIGLEVNNVANDRAGLLDRVELKPPAQRSLF